MVTNVFAKAVVETAQNSDFNSQAAAIKSVKWNLEQQEIDIDEFNIFTCGFSAANGWGNAAMILMIFTVIFGVMGYIFMEPFFYVVAGMVGMITILCFGYYFSSKPAKRIIAYWDNRIIFTDEDYKDLNEIVVDSNTKVDKSLDQVIIYSEGKSYKIESQSENVEKYNAFVTYFNWI